MPAMKRHPTEYPGVVYVSAQRVGGRGTERVYYVRFKRDGRVVEEKAGRQFADNMTPAKAARVRGERIEGKRQSRKEQREAAEAAKAAEAERWTIAKLWTEYKAHNPGLKGLTTDENRFTKHLEDDLGGKEPRELLPLDIERLKRKLEASKTKRHGGGTLSPATVRNTLELLRRIVNFGVRKHLCDPMPFKIGSKKSGASVAMPQVNNLKTEDLGPAQLKALLAAMDKSPDIQTANFMRLALYTGMRRGELFRLTWGDIDFDRGFIRIRGPKGGKDQTIPLNEAARDVLENHPKPFSKSPYVFPGRKGAQRADVNKAVRVITDAAGLPRDFRPLHGLRHAFASMLASSGQVDLYTLQKLLTHKSPTMTQRYAHLRDEALRKASDLAGVLVTSAAEPEKGKEEAG